MRSTTEHGWESETNRGRGLEKNVDRRMLR